MKYGFDLSSQWSGSLSGHGQSGRWLGASVEGSWFVSSHTNREANNSSQECLFLFANLETHPLPSKYVMENEPL